MKLVLCTLAALALAAPAMAHDRPPGNDEGPPGCEPSHQTPKKCHPPKDVSMTSDCPDAGAHWPAWTHGTARHAGCARCPRHARRSPAALLVPLARGSCRPSRPAGSSRQAAHVHEPSRADHPPVARVRRQPARRRLRGLRSPRARGRAGAHRAASASRASPPTRAVASASPSGGARTRARACARACCGSTPCAPRTASVRSTCLPPHDRLPRRRPQERQRHGVGLVGQPARQGWALALVGLRAERRHHEQRGDGARGARAPRSARPSG